MNEASRVPRVLPAVIAVLIAVAALRVGQVWIGFTGAAAQSSQEGSAAPVIRNKIASQSDPAVDPSTVEERLLARLAARREALDRREADLETREALLRVAETRIEEKLRLMREERVAITDALAARQRAEQQEFEDLSNAYERMKPKDAARIFDALDDDILVPVAAGMRTQAISGVLAEMQPEKARALTLKLAERARGAHNEDL